MNQRLLFVSLIKEGSLHSFFYIRRSYPPKLFNDGSAISLQAFLGFVQGGDDGLPAFSAFQKINGGRYLWQHGGEFKLALADIIPGLVYGHVADGLFLGRTVV